MKWLAGAGMSFLVIASPVLYGLSRDPTLMHGHPPSITFVAGILMLLGPLFGPLGILCAIRGWREAASFGGSGVLKCALVVFVVVFLGAFTWSCYEWLQYLS